MTVDQQFRAFVEAVDVSTPPAPPLSLYPSEEPRKLSPALVMAVSFVGVLLLGAAVLIPQLGGAADVASGGHFAHGPGQYPQLLIDIPGWSLVRAHQADGFAEYSYASDSGGAGIVIEPGDARTLEALVADRAASADERFELSVHGYSAVATRYAETSRWAVMWIAGEYVYEFRIESASDADAALALTNSLVGVSRAEWIEATGDAVVAPEDVADEVNEMLRDIPLPPTFDPSRMSYNTGLELFGVKLFYDRYQLGVEAAGAAACSWIEYWLDAIAVGDNQAAAEAVAAMATNVDWAILIEMSESGAYPHVLNEFAVAMAGDGRLWPGNGPNSPTVANSHDQSLGCNEIYPRSPQR